MSFSSLSNTTDAIMTSRLNRIQTAIRALAYSTKEEYLATLTSLVNAALSLDYKMQPLVPIIAESPAQIGDFTANLILLNQDAIDLASEIERLEDDAGSLYNLTAATQTSICQQIREQIYQNSSTLFMEEFVNSNNVGSSTGTIDYKAGVAQLGLIAEKTLAPSLILGGNSVGSSTDDIAYLSDGDIETRYLWNGTLLELIATFPSPVVVNRLVISLDQYTGYELTSFTTSPDGSIYEDVLADLSTPVILMDGSSGKYSGTATIDFPPKSASAIRLVIENQGGVNGIGLRDISFLQRSYQASATLTSTVQTAPAEQVLFSADDQVFDPYTSVLFQISPDSVHYTTIQPGLITLPVNWWYRVTLTRSSSAFSSAAPSNTDPAPAPGFTLVSSSSVPLDPTLLERTLVFSNVTSLIIPLGDVPIPGTLQISAGTVSIPFTLTDRNVVTLAQSFPSVTLTYQTPTPGAINLSQLEPYYTPLLYGVSFSKQ